MLRDYITIHLLTDGGEQRGAEKNRLGPKKPEEKKETKMLPRHYSCGGDQRRESHCGLNFCPSIHQLFFQPQKKKMNAVVSTPHSLS